MTFYDPRVPALAQQREIAAQQHDRFIDLIEARDADGAAELAIAHWELSRSEIEQFVSPASLDIPLGEAPATAKGRP
jgi:DNA-binding GntR family transcriptional regulator